MSLSEQSSSSESDNDSIPDVHKLQPYDLEPEIASSDVSTTTSDENTNSSDSEIADYSRIGNTSWCSYGKCFPMSYTERLCCRDTNEVPDEYFEGNHNYKHPSCKTMHPSCRRNNTTISSSFSILYLPIFIIYIALNPFFFSKNIINEKEYMTNFMILKKIFQLQTFLVDFPTGTIFSLLLAETIRI